MKQHSFKVLDTRTGEYIDLPEFVSYYVRNDGVLMKEFIGSDEMDIEEPADWFRPVFPHEEREMEFLPREGESFVDRCNRLFPVEVESLGGLFEGN